MRDVKTILCPVDFSETMTPVAEAACYLARKLEAELEVLYVAPDMGRYGAFQIATEDIETFTANIIRGAEKTMTEALTTHFADVTARGRVVTGYAPEAIINEIEATGAEMVVMGTHGRGGLNRVIFGSVAEHVVKHAAVPVVTIRPDNV